MCDINCKPTPSYEELLTENIALRAENTALKAHMAELDKRIQDLENKLGQNSRNSSKPPSSDPPSVQRPSGKPSGRKRGGQPGHKGRTRTLLPMEEVNHVLDVKPDSCQRCKTPLEGEDPSPQRHQVTEIPPISPEVTEYRLHALGCPCCGKVTRAELPPGVSWSAFGGRLQAMIGICSGAYRLSKRTIEELMMDFFGVNISLGSVSACEESVSEALEAPIAEARNYVQEQSVAYADETGWKEGNKKAWLWVAVTNVVTVFMIHAGRGKVAAQALLGQFAGILVSDRWNAYNVWDVWMRQLCWAHLKRNFEAFVDRGGRAAKIGKALLLEVKTMFGWWYRIRDGTLERSSFRTYMSPLRQRVEALLREGAECRESKTEKTCRRILKLAPALWTFVRIEGVEPTNNTAERAVRPGVLWRKGSFGTDSPRGSRFAERMMTTVATCKQQGKNVLDYVTSAVDSSLRGESSPSLLPVPAQVHHADSSALKVA